MALCQGTGAWVRDMARSFPSADFFGVDSITVPPPPSSSLLSGGGSCLLRPAYDSDDESPEMPNVRFERSDVNGGLKHGNAEFDVVHCRSVLTVAVSTSPSKLSIQYPKPHRQIPDYVSAILEFSRVLRPSGLLLLAEMTVPYSLCDGSGATNHHPDSALSEFTEAVQSALRAVGLDPDIRLTLESVVRKGPFSQCETRDIMIPLGEWPQGKNVPRSTVDASLTCGVQHRCSATEDRPTWTRSARDDPPIFDAAAAPGRLR